MNTVYKTNKKICTVPYQKKKSRTGAWLPLAACAAFLVSALAFPDTVRASVTDTLEMCASLLIPSLFPFMVAGELFFTLGGHRVPARLLGKPFERIFGISGAGAGAFLLGAVCGLPLGAKYALTLYKIGEISQHECEILMGISNNAGLGFVVMGIGYGIWDSMLFGWLLYFCQIFGSLMAGIILSKRKKPKGNPCSIAPATRQTEKIRLSSVFADAVSSSAVNMLKLCGFVVFFGVLSAFLKQLCTALALPSLCFVTLSAFTEITFAAAQAHAFFVSGSSLAVYSAKVLTFFAVGFSGMSAHAQTASLADTQGVGMKKYFAVKLLGGVICSVTGAIILLYFNF